MKFLLAESRSTTLHLAPMEGVVDWVMRDFLTQIGGVDHCVTEFIRVVDKVYPDYVYHRYCPELKTNSQTRSGVPVFVQLLGGQAEPMALNAQKAVSLGARGIDLNFGCPAKTVNKNDGGAALLKSCDRVYDIVSAVRTALPKEIPVTAKIRLGFDHPTSCIDIAQAVEAAGAEWITIHCRTKTDGYKPPAYWDWIPKIKEKTKIKIVANGEIWTVADFNRCKEVTDCDDFMIGRGVLSDPFLFRKISDKTSSATLDSDWSKIKLLLPQFFEASQIYRHEEFAISRTKQWLRALSLKNPQAKDFFDEVKIILKPKEFQQRLDRL
ncbi:MAG: tRNA-dihydrouridine synthase family protein [Bdellovibrionota bacterium]